MLDFRKQFQEIIEQSYIPVSYTHLDVYKRQNIDTEIGSTKVICNQMGYIFANEHIVNAVSYTHLDVYKRQDKGFSTYSHCLDDSGIETSIPSANTHIKS